MIVAEQVAAALSGEVVSNAVNIPQIQPQDAEVIGPYVPLATLLGRLATGLAGENLERLEVTYTGRLADADTRLLTSAVLSGAFGGPSRSTSTWSTPARSPSSGGSR